MGIATADFDYHLPEDLIASRPLPRRDDSRMMVVDRAAGTIEHRKFGDFVGMLRPRDLCVLNDTRVVPSRFWSDDRRIEIVRTRVLGEREWKCMVRPGKRMKEGSEVVVDGVTGRVLRIEPDGERVIEWDACVPESAGELALPHYMGRVADGADAERYQTVYAKAPGAIAAPTAGLHFTPEVLAGIEHCHLTLHVGVGTFRPVKAAAVGDHSMHSERYEVPGATAQAIAAAGRTIAVGTTVARVLEHLGRKNAGRVVPGAGETDIFIYPGFEFSVTGALLTNFHLPRSTLLMLVCAFAGTGLALEAYTRAVEARYRFYSYGDCMLVV